MKKRLSYKIDRTRVTVNKFTNFCIEISKIADFDEITGEIIYDNDEETEKKIVEILDKYFL